MPVKESSGLLVMVDGKPEPIEKCSWVKRAPCGCLAAIMCAHWSDDDVIATEQQAWARFYDDADPAVMKEHRAVGYTVSVARFAEGEIASAWTDCNHDRSAWTRDQSAPEGYVWAMPYAMRERKTDRAHLVKATPAGRHNPETQAPLCEGAYANWSVQGRSVREHVLCRKCVAARDAAKAAVA